MSLHRKRAARIAGSIVVTGLCVAYIVWKIDVAQTVHILLHADFAWFLLSFGLAIAATWPMAWRWQRLLRAKGIEERLGWLVRCYFVSWFVGQVLPTSLGGDASRIYETTRRHPGRGGIAAGSVLLERALGGAATLTLAAIGFALAIGRYDVGAYLWIEGAFILATIALGFVLFSRRVRRPLRRLVPIARTVRIERPLRAVYEGIHTYRENGWLLVGVFALTVFVQAWRVLVDLGGRQGGRRRPVAAAVLRDGADAVPGHARPVHDQRARRAGGVLRQLPDQARRAGRRGLRDRVPVLPRDDLPRPPRAP